MGGLDDTKTLGQTQHKTWLETTFSAQFLLCPFLSQRCFHAWGLRPPCFVVRLGALLLVAQRKRIGAREELPGRGCFLFFFSPPALRKLERGALMPKRTFWFHKATAEWWRARWMMA